MHQLATIRGTTKTKTRSSSETAALVHWFLLLDSKDFRMIGMVRWGMDGEWRHNRQAHSTGFSESELRKFWRGKMMRLLPTQRKGEFLCIPESFFPSSTSSSLTSCKHAIFPFTLPTIHSRIIRHTLLVVFFILLLLLLLLFLPGSLRLLCEIKSTFHMVSTEPPIVLAWIELQFLLFLAPTESQPASMVIEEEDFATPPTTTTTEYTCSLCMTGLAAALSVCLSDWSLGSTLSQQRHWLVGAVWFGCRARSLWCVCF